MAAKPPLTIIVSYSTENYGVGGELDSEIRCALNSAGGEQVGEGDAAGLRDIEYEIHPDMVGQAFAAMLPIGADLRFTVFHPGDPATAMDEYAQGKRESSGIRRRRRRSTPELEWVDEPPPGSGSR
jgi:hypothetical protein